MVMGSFSEEIKGGVGGGRKRKGGKEKQKNYKKETLTRLRLVQYMQDAMLVKDIEMRHLDTNLDLK